MMQCGISTHLHHVIFAKGGFAEYLCEIPSPIGRANLSEHRSIKARTDSSASSVDQDLQEVTGERAGLTKFHLHTTGGIDPYLDLVQAALWGNIPSPNYDSIVRTEVSADVITYTFRCDGLDQFLITISAATTNPVVTIADTTDLITEGLAHILTETGDNLIQER